MSKESFNVQMIAAAIAGLAFYFFSDDMDEVRIELDKLFKTNTISYNRYVGNRFGGKFKTVTEQATKFKKNINVKNLIPTEMPNVDSLSQKLYNSPSLLNSKIEKSIDKFNNINDISLYVILLALLITIIFYGKVFWENNKIPFVDENGAGIIVILVFTVFILHGRNFLDFVLTFIKNDNKVFKINSKCEADILNQNVEKPWMVVTGISAFIVLVLLLVIGIFYTNKLIEEKEEKEEETSDGLRYFILACIVICFLFISIFWITWGCKTLSYGKGVNCIDNNELSIEDKLVTLSLIFLSISGFVSWSVN